MEAICTPMKAIASGGQIVAAVLSTAAALRTGYQAVGSPYTTLEDTWKKLHDIKDYLEAISDGQRQKIEAAAQKRHCKSVADIEDQFQELWDDHTELIQQYEQASLIKRHLNPAIRGRVSNLEAEVKALLQDTRTTTRAHALFSPLSSPPPPGGGDDPLAATGTPADLDANDGHEAIEMNTV